jgi:YcxB-like protein
MGTAPAASATPTTADWVTTMDDVVDTSHLLARSFRRFLTILGAVVGLAGAALVLGGDAGLGVWLLLSGAIVFPVLFFRPVERAVIGRRVAYLVGRSCEVEAGGDGLVFRQAGATGTLEWRAMTGVVENARTIALTSGRQARFAIPKRAFGSPDRAAAFAELLRERIAEANSAAPRG